MSITENSHHNVRIWCGDYQIRLWERPDWPAFTWNETGLSRLLARVSREQGRLLDDFDGKLTTSKWAKIARCSQDTAYRDILDLIERGALRKDPGGGRSTSYSLILE